MEYTIKFRAETEVTIKVNADDIEKAKKIAVTQIDSMVDYKHKLKRVDDNTEVIFLQPLMYVAQ